LGTELSHDIATYYAQSFLHSIQQVPLTPETLTRYYVNSAAGQPVPLSNLVTLKTATEPNAV
jgi:multidrug efflux pump subunit AcrB